MSKQAVLFIASFLFAASLASADLITYDVTVNTSSISGTVGSLDFNFNPGPLITQSASLQILDFSGNGTLAGSPLLTGDVSGTLPATVTFDNGSVFNDYFEGFTFGTKLSFDVSLYGPALSSPMASPHREARLRSECSPMPPGRYRLSRTTQPMDSPLRWTSSSMGQRR